MKPIATINDPSKRIEVVSERDLSKQLRQMFDQGRVTELKLPIDKQLAEHPESGTGHFWKGRLGEKAHDLKLAILCYETAIEKDPANPHFPVFLASALERKLGMDSLSNAGIIRAAQLEKIESTLKKAVELAPNHQGYKSRYAFSLAGQNRLNDAFELIQEAFLQYGKALVLENEALEFPIALQTIFLEDDLQRFLAGVEESEGKYAIMLVQHSFLAPVAFFSQKGWIDSTGLVQIGLGSVADGLLDEAVSLFSELQHRLPRLHDVWGGIGLCHTTMATRGEDPERNLAAASEVYQKELDLNPSAWKAMLGLGLLEKKKERWNEAVQWLKQALEVAPVSVQVLTNLVATLYDRDLQEGISFSGLPEYVQKYLGHAHGIMPNHPAVVSLTDHFGKIFRANLPEIFRCLPLDTRFQ